MARIEKDERINALLASEAVRGIESTYWLSFCDPKKPDGQQFLGVIITKALGLTHALANTKLMGINPGGEVLAFEVPKDKLNADDYDRLFSKNDLIKRGFINK